VRYLYASLIFVPGALAAKLLGLEPVWVLVASALGIIPLASILGRATEELAVHTGSRGCVLPNATFGNAAELIITVVALLVSTGGIVVMSEFLVTAMEPVITGLGLTELFLGVILVPIIGNAAEHLVAVRVAHRDQMDLSLGISLGFRVSRPHLAGRGVQLAGGRPTDHRLCDRRPGLLPPSDLIGGD
jgi:Ca2+/H+ antiporter